MGGITNNDDFSACWIAPSLLDLDSNHIGCNTFCDSINCDGATRSIAKHCKAHYKKEEAKEDFKEQYALCTREVVDKASGVPSKMFFSAAKVKGFDSDAVDVHINKLTRFTTD